MSNFFLPYAHQSINDSDREAVVKALESEIITRGEYVTAFEKEIAEYCGAKYAVAFNSASSGLNAAFFAANVSSSDRIISSPNTFIATIGGGITRGGQLQLVDIDRSTGNLDLDQLNKILDYPSTRGKPVIVPIHFSGIAVDMKALSHLIRHPDAIVIEDAAHAIGSVYPDGQKVGSCAWSQMTVFSFHPAKTITTGEGGIVTTNNSDLYHRLCLFRQNGIEREKPYLEGDPAPGYYEVQALTGNFHLTDFQAALGSSQLSRINSFIKKRRKLVKCYREQLKDLEGVTVFTDRYDEKTAFHLFVVQIDFDTYGITRDKVMEVLQERGIGTQVHYIPLYRHPSLRKKNSDFSEQFPETEAYYAQTLTLPLYYDLKEEDVVRVCRELKTIIHRQE